jgi:hypothetical protein
MNRLRNPISLALILLPVLGATAPRFAQQPAKDLVPFKASWTGQNQPIVIATDPAIVSQAGTLMGQSDLFGAFTGVALGTLHMDVGGKPLFATVVGEWSMANGDALSVEITGLFPPQTTPGSQLLEGALVITNGKGRFLGARGTGFITGVLQVDPVTRHETRINSVEGLITRPK